MKTIAVLLACVCLAQCGPAKKEISDQEAESYEYEYARHDPSLSALEPAHYAEASPVLSGHIREHPRPGYSAGGPLASIAKGAADQAHTQLSNQHSAAGQAAYVAKNQLAQAAAQSAATAAAALAGKQILLLGLEQQSRDAHVAVDGEKQQLAQAERAANAARNTAKQAMHQVQVITAALNTAQATADHAAQAAAEAAAELAAQTAMVGQAKARAETVEEQLSAARVDYETTQSAAEKAAKAASAAQNNAASAAIHVADTAGTSAILSHEPANLPPPARLAEPSALHDPSALRSAALREPLHGYEEQHQSAGYAGPGLHGGAYLESPIRGPIHGGSLRGGPHGLHRGEQITLANALPVDSYDFKGYQY